VSAEEGEGDGGEERKMWQGTPRPSQHKAWGQAGLMDNRLGAK